MRVLAGYLLATTLIAGVAAAGQSAVELDSGQARSPNIVVLLADDLRADAVHALGGAQVATPAIDRLVAEGLSFDRAYCMGARQGAVCAPSRAMLLTGRSLFRLPGNPFDLGPEPVFLPEWLARAGYRTFATGKWHNGKRAFADAFDDGDAVFFGGMGSHTELEVHAFDPAGDYPNQARHPIESFSSTAFVDAAVDFLRREDERPFFLYVSFTAPHDPRTPPAEYAALYDPAEIELPQNFLPEHPFDNGELEVRDERLAARPRTPEVVRQHLADYFGMVTQMDAQIGRLLAVLDERGLRENTIVVFVSDHGLAVGSHGLLGKQNLYEHSTRAPLVLAGPGIPAGVRSEAFVYLFDLFPTLCELTGREIPEEVEGRSLVSAFEGLPDSWRSSVFTVYGRPERENVMRAVRTERWKWILYPGRERAQLFDLDADPHETSDLVNDPRFEQSRKELQALLRAEQERWKDPLAEE